MAKGRSPPSPWDELHASVCKVLTHPVRIQIMGLLKNRQMAVGDIAKLLGRSQPNISQHLTLMRNKGFVVATRDGCNVYYRLTDARLVDALDLIRDALVSEPVRRSPLRPS